MMLPNSHEQSYPTGIDYHPDDNACVSASLAYLMFRIDAPKQFWQPKAIDTITGRTPGGLTFNAGAGLLALMDLGAEITDIVSFDNNRFIKEGLPYLEEYHSEGWLKDTPQAFYEYWTDERLSIQQKYTADFLAGSAVYGKQYEHFQADPTTALLTDIANASTSILVPTARMDPNIYHSVVVTDYSQDTGDVNDEGAFTTFDNQYQPPITNFEGRYFKTRLFLPDRGIVIVRKSAN